MAAALPESSADLRAWHLSRSCVGPDDDVADGLVAVADRARARGAHGGGGHRTEPGSRAHLAAPTTGERMLRAGASAWLAGQPAQADTLLEKATTLATDRAMLAEIDDIRGNLALRTGSLDEGRRLLLRAADLSEGLDPDAAVMRLADVISGCFYQSDTAGALAAAATLERLIGSADRHGAHPRADGDRDGDGACRRRGRAMDSQGRRRPGEPIRICPPIRGGRTGKSSAPCSCGSRGWAET